MNMIAPIQARADADPRPSRSEVAGMVALAARTVAPLWPLESAIAVNPLSGFEHLPFEQGVAEAARHFGAATGLPLGQWRTLMARGAIERRVLRDVAIGRLGGIGRAFIPAAAGVTRLDLLMARLCDLPAADAPAASAPIAPDAAFVAKWCAAFFESGMAASAMPNRDAGLYPAVLALAAHDPDFGALAGAAGAELLLHVPRDPLDAIAEALVALAPRIADPVTHLARLVARLPGWAGHIRWREAHADAALTAATPATMADLLALWLLLDRAGACVPAPAPVGTEPAAVAAALATHFGVAVDAIDAEALGAVTSFDDGMLSAMFMLATEWSYANALAPRLQAAARNGAEAAAAPADAQLVFCIDVRSEPFRRAIEAEGRYETLGYAGFFGVPIALHPLGGDGRRRMLPVLLAPQHDVREAPAPGHEAAAARLLGAEARSRRTAALLDAAKRGPATAFATAEAVGPLAGLMMAARTLAPRLVHRLGTRLAPARDEVVAPTLGEGGCSAHGHAPHDHATPFTLAEKIGYAEALFRLTGLATPTARLVVLVGHGAQAVNNPYAAALDCGACGGHAGGANARILAAMLNDPAVRAGLAERGIVVPETSLFVAAEHNTTTDAVTIFDRDRVPESHRADLGTLRAALARAGTANRRRRAATLGRAPDDLLTGSVHWGEVRPEWGLARNAAFIAGPRWLTRALDLDGRAFLHSYDWRRDPDGTALATILAAPMVVAQWINGQYLFSTLDNHAYGSGDKTTQNVLGGIGVIQGNGGDLRIGLPRQSLFDDDGTPYHIPQRLLTVVLAPFERVEAIVTANDLLARLFGNGWVTLVVIDPETGRALRWRRDDAAAPDLGCGADLSPPDAR